MASWTWERLTTHFQEVLTLPGLRTEFAIQARAMLRLIPMLRNDPRFVDIQVVTGHDALELTLNYPFRVWIWATGEQHCQVAAYETDETPSAETVVPLDQVPDTAATYLEKLRQHALPTAR